MEPKILFEDDEIIVAYKPAGFATQTKNIGEQDMVSFLKNYRVSHQEEPYIGLISRLDQPVEGVLVFGKNQGATATLSKELQEHSIAKHYYAVITRGKMPTEGQLVDFMVKDARINRAKVVAESDPRAKKAVLNYKVVGQIDDRKLIDVELVTGRFHQIRCQFASRTAPILGDVKYGGQRTGRPLALCSYKIIFHHPLTFEEMEFSITPKGEDFSEFQF